jgi:hypothetical protein
MLGLALALPWLLLLLLMLRLLLLLLLLLSLPWLLPWLSLPGLLLVSLPGLLLLVSLPGLLLLLVSLPGLLVLVSLPLLPLLPWLLLLLLLLLLLVLLVGDGWELGASFSSAAPRPASAFLPFASLISSVAPSTALRDLRTGESREEYPQSKSKSIGAWSVSDTAARLDTGDSGGDIGGDAAFGETGRGGGRSWGWGGGGGGSRDTEIGDGGRAGDDGGSAPSGGIAADGSASMKSTSDSFCQESFHRTRINPSRPRFNTAWTSRFQSALSGFFMVHPFFHRTRICFWFLTFLFFRISTGM